MGMSASAPYIHPCSCSPFCHQYPELLVASYNNNEDAPHEPDGVALVWNMKYKKATPEYVFHCQVPEGPAASFCSSAPHVIAGGASSFFHDKHVRTPPLLLLLLLFSDPPPPRSPSPSSCLRARTGIHLHHICPPTHVREVPEKTCGAGGEWNPSSAAGLSVWGWAGYHVHLNKGPVFRQASRESSTAPLLCPALLQCLPSGSFIKTG